MRATVGVARVHAVARSAAAIATAPATFDVPERRPRFLAAALDQRLERRAVAHDERADALGAAELVRRDRHQVGGGGRAPDVEPRHRLHRVGVQHAPAERARARGRRSRRAAGWCRPRC